MTCIVGVVKGNSVWLAGDRAATGADGSRRTLKDPKVFMVDDVGFGVCGMPKVLDAVQHSFDPPEHPGYLDDKGYLVNGLVPQLRETLKRMDCVFPDKETGITCFYGSILVAYKGALYELQSNFQLIRNQNEYAAVGSGSHLALGYLASGQNKNDPRKRVLGALEASAAGHATVAPPFDVIVVKG